jgi:hypothetical protein
MSLSYHLPLSYHMQLSHHMWPSFHMLLNYHILFCYYVPPSYHMPLVLIIQLEKQSACWQASSSSPFKEILNFLELERASPLSQQPVTNRHLQPADSVLELHILRSIPSMSVLYLSATVYVKENVAETSNVGRCQIFSRRNRNSKFLVQDAAINHICEQRVV